MSAQWIMKKKGKKDLDPVGVLQQGLLWRATLLLHFFFFRLCTNVMDMQAANVGKADSHSRCLIIELMRPKNNFAD